MSDERRKGIILCTIGIVIIISVILFWKIPITNSFFDSIMHLLYIFVFLIAIILSIVGLVFIVQGRMVKIQPTPEIVKQLMSQLPTSPTPLIDKNIKKIHQLFPVPSDYDIIWAEVRSFGGHPSGIIITKQALILKAEKNEVKKQNKQIKKENKGKKKEDKKNKIPYIYKMIPWDYFSPDEFKIGKDEKSKNNLYYFIIDQSAAFCFETSELFVALRKMQQTYTVIKKNLEDIEIASVTAAINTINVEPTFYMAKNGAANTSTGHGIIAEDLGTKLDKISGMDATVVGRDNAKNGPDKLVNKTPIQCKYYNSGANSVRACFDENGLFRYYDLNGNPMNIEVPQDQYITAIEEMKLQIQSGKVPGVSDPEKAVDIIRQGKITYAQAVNIAKAGTIESISYDVAHASIRCLSVFGISFVVVFAQVFWNTKDIKQAAKSALITSAKIYGLSILGSVISSQLARAGIENLFYPMMKSVINQLPKSFVEKMATATKGMVKPGVSVVNASSDAFARFLSVQVSVSCVMFLVFSMPDIYNLVSNNISKGQFVMNIAERLAGSAAGTASAVIVGGYFGPAPGFIAGLLANLGASFIVHNFTNLFREDDDTIISRMFTAVLINTAMDFMLSQSEQEDLVALLEQDNKKLKKLKEKLINSPTQTEDIKRYLFPKIKRIVKNRMKVKSSEEEIKQIADEIVSKGEFNYEM